MRGSGTESMAWKMNNPKNFTVGCLANELGICTETIRYYHRIGLLPVPTRLPGSTVRVYGEDDLRLLRFIKQAQQLGFSLEEIRKLIALSNGSHCQQVQSLARQKLHGLEQRMAEIADMRDTIAALLNECAKNNRDAQCPMIDALWQNTGGEYKTGDAGNTTH